MGTSGLSDEAERLALIHLEACGACRLGHVARIRAVRSGQLERELAGRLPLPPAIIRQPATIPSYTTNRYSTGVRAGRVPREYLRPTDAPLPRGETPGAAPADGNGYLFSPGRGQASHSGNKKTALQRGF